MMENKEELTLMSQEDGVSKKPRRKADKSIKGRLEVWDEEGVYEFCQTRERPEMKREVMHNHGGVKVAKTAGEKENSYIMSVKVDGSSPDPMGDLLAKAHGELKGKALKTPQIRASNFLYNEEGKLQVWRKKQTNELSIFMTIPTEGDKSKVYSQLMAYVVEVNKCINRLK
jgi:hypothetical protein